MGIRELGIVLDTNVIISSLVLGSKPKKLMQLILKEGVRVYTSLQLISELLDILRKKFSFSEEKIKILEKELLKNFKPAYPSKKSIFLGTLKTIKYWRRQMKV